MPNLHDQATQEFIDRNASDMVTERLIPEVPRWRGRRSGFMRGHPLLTYSAFVAVSLVLLGGMAVASLPA
ncbi:MAG: hypothetical protein MJE12_10665 [Alphaproteobacteria bacterium]|nr:hypothetical protein [Alphaproteobacteria bacterium]